MRTWGVRVDLLLLLLVLVVFGPIVGEMTAQPVSRLAFTGALVDDHSVNLTGYRLGVDQAQVDGHPVSDKAPFQPLVAVPFYAAERAVGAVRARDASIKGDLTLWWLTLWFSVIPCAALLILMRRLAFPVGAQASLIAALALAFGSPIATWATQLYGHLFAALLGFGAWFVLQRNARASGALLAGLLAGFAVATEYPCFIIAVALGGYLLVRRRTQILHYVLGLVPGALIVTSYQWIVFGNPLKTPYSTKATNVPRVDGLGMPSPRNIVLILFGARGFLIMAPVVLVAVGGAIALARRPGPLRDHAVMALVVFGAFVVMASAGSPYGGESPAPRYVIPALPFLVVPLATIARDYARVVVLTAAWGFVAMLLPTLTVPLVSGSGLPFGQWISRLRAHDVVRTVWTMGLGGAGWVVYVGAIVAVALALRAVVRKASVASAESPALAGTTP